MYDASKDIAIVFLKVPDEICTVCVPVAVSVSNW